MKWVRLENRGSATRTQEGERYSVREVGEKARDEESRCSLYPPATSLILAMEDRKAEEK